MRGAGGSSFGAPRWSAVGRNGTIAGRLTPYSGRSSRCFAVIAVLHGLTMRNCGQLVNWCGAVGDRSEVSRGSTSGYLISGRGRLASRPLVSAEKGTLAPCFTVAVVHLEGCAGSSQIHDFVCDGFPCFAWPEATR